MKLETKRLRLRPPRREDITAYIEIQSSDFVLRYNAMTPATYGGVERKLSDPDFLENTVFLEHRQSGELVGAIFLEPDDLRYGVASQGLSYFLDARFARQGYMKEALGAVIACLFEEKNLTCICARVFAPNTASRALLQSLGFTENGIIPHCVKGYAGEIFDDVIHTLFRGDFYKE